MVQRPICQPSQRAIIMIATRTNIATTDIFQFRYELCIILLSKNKKRADNDLVTTYPQKIEPIFICILAIKRWLNNC